MSTDTATGEPAPVDNVKGKGKVVLYADSPTHLVCNGV